jgi:trigger factor
MEITVQKTGLEVVIQGKYDNNDLNNIIETYAKELAKTVKMPGFRAGKVPVKAVMQLHKEKLTEDAKNKILEDIFNGGLKKEEISQQDIVGEPLLVNQEENEKETSIEIKVFLKPVIEFDDSFMEKLPEIKAEEISDDEVENKINDLLKTSAKLIDVDKPLEIGDAVVFDFEGFIDGTPFEGGKAENYSLELGSGQFVPGFEDQLVGLKAGDKKSVKITFPENYPNEELKGKEAVFECKIHKVQKREIPELTNESAKTLLEENEIDSNLGAIENLKKAIKKRLQKEKINQQIIDPNVQEQVKNILLNTIQFDIPANVVENEIQFRINAEVEKMSPDEVKKIQENINEEYPKLRDVFYKNASDSVRLTFIVDELAKREKIAISDKQLVDIISYQALMEGQNPEEVIKNLEDRGMLPLMKMNLIEAEVISALLTKRVK